MVWLTADIHHMSMRGSDQALLSSETEVECCSPYLEIANEYGIIPTLFLTGKVVKEEGKKIRKLQNEYAFEIGGHTYRAFKPRLLYGICNHLLGLRNGPRFLQRRDIRLTRKVIGDILGVLVLAWRDHAYRHDKNTYSLLAELGFKVVSDEVNGKKYSPQKAGNGLYSFSINVTPDHENLIHSEHNTTGYSVCEWLDKIKNEIKVVDEKNGVATLLVHPACMAIEDNFKTFEVLCEFISHFETAKMQDLVRLTE